MISERPVRETLKTLKKTIGLKATGMATRRVGMVLWMVLIMSVVRAQAGPVITGFLVNGVQSTTGPVGASLTIQGSGFGNTQGFSTATLNGIAVAGNGVKPTSWSNTAIVVVIPKTASSGPVVVKVAGTSSNAMNFNIGAVITGISPGTALVGNSVTISGQGFGTSGGTVAFNGTSATTSSWTDASIVAQVPNAATSGPVVVTVGGQASNGMTFTPTPQITGLTPGNGLSGATVTITGNSFGPTQANGNSTVTFNGVATTTSGWSNTSLTVTAPSGAVTGPVVVTVNGVASAGQVFTYTPQITGITPNPALANTVVTIQGNNFNSAQGSSTVTFNGVAATVNSWANTSIQAVVPGSTGAGPVVVTVNGVASNGIGFSFPLPYSFSLTRAPNGNVLTANDNFEGNWTYTYDDFNRLATAVTTNGTGCAESYDEEGNRWSQQPYGNGNSCNTSLLTFTGNTGNSQNNNNQMDGYSYDAAGNLLSDGNGGTAGHSYTYDAENRIIAVDGGTTATYAYDAEGRRVQKVTGAGTAGYLYNGSGQVITELNGSGVATRGEVYADGRHVATYSNGTTYFVQGDWLGTERIRSLVNGDIFETCTNLPFGDGQICQTSTDPSPNHFTGKPRDTETGLDYFSARFYSSNFGRFVTPDWSAKPVTVPYASFGDPQSLNLYSYTKNEPVSAVDADGHQCYACHVEQPRIQCDLCRQAQQPVIPRGVNYRVVKVGVGADDRPVRVVEAGGVVYPLPGMNYTARQKNWFGGCPGSTCHTFNGLFPPMRPLYLMGKTDFLAMQAMILTGVPGAVKPNPAPTGNPTVLGHYPEYIDTARNIGGNVLDIPSETWNAMSQTQQVDATLDNIDATFARGDRFVFATPTEATRPDSWYEFEQLYMDAVYGVNAPASPPPTVPPDCGFGNGITCFK